MGFLAKATKVKQALGKAKTASRNFIKNANNQRKSRIIANYSKTPQAKKGTTVNRIKGFLVGTGVTGAAAAGYGAKYKADQYKNSPEY